MPQKFGKNGFVQVRDKMRINFRSLFLKVNPAGSASMSKYYYYAFIFSILILFASAVSITNGYFHYVNVYSYYSYQHKILAPFSLTGYEGMFLVVAFAPLPDYLILPFYGYLSSVGEFNIFLTFLVSVAAMLFEMGIEYAGGRLAGRPLLLKVLSYFKITEKDLEVADHWIKDHGSFSIFIATFIPYFKNVTSLAAGTLKMNAGLFFLSNLVGFSIRFGLLLYIGYTGIFVLTPSWDYSHRLATALVGVLALMYIIAYTWRKISTILAYRVKK
ncbi:alkaline phosphatase [Thermoplasma volcanium GSS1]|uniref:Alkaline phosphatase n=1 Tax=Thermoplasma volcanium (strain ATCC 51530 / DSM 4299 / JCM 9571 / NBRC 15438 / GSS1) TaxID=273116 RepID=Q97BY1_THEVO|nr:DedA family protein [Thermoplasma volcanium]BAB59466.1 alkaline phosphatase [Thermoplasma volcanium GSS1]